VGEQAGSAGSGARATRPWLPWLALVLAAVVVGGLLLARGRAAGGYAPAVLLERVALAPASRTTSAGVPVPSAAARCPARGRPAPGGARWCAPAGVSASTLDRWYARTLPAGRDAGALRWCVSQVLAKGTRRALWSAGGALVGYDLPEQAGARAAVVDVLRLPGHRCPAAARASRQGSA
jgi:hypothetical protein